MLDRRSNLPLADLVGGIIPEAIEKRARAFAAELLLPQRVAYRAFEVTDQTQASVDAILADLMKEYSVSQWIAGHQLRNSIKRFSGEASRDQRPVLAYLEWITSQPLTNRRR